MLDRFNKLLNSLSLDVATASRVGIAPDKVWVVYDANALGIHELQLLTRLVQQFPGSGVSVVLMFSSETTQNDDVTRPNKQFVSWGLDLPTAEQKLTAIQQARKNGQEESAIQFFNKLTKSASKKAPAPSTLEAVAAPTRRSAPTSTSKKKSTASRIVPWLLGIGGLLAISLLLALWLNPEVWPKVIAQAEDAFYQVTGQKNPKAVEPKEEVITEVAAPKDEAGNPMPTPNLADKAEGSPTAAATTPAEQAQQPQPSQTSQPQVPASPAPEPVAPPAKDKAEEKLVTELPDIAVSGRLWLKKLPEDSFVLEHKTFSRVKDAQAFIRSKDYLTNARIVPLFKDDKDEARFVVVTGFFRSKERAKNTRARLGLSEEVLVTPSTVAVAQSQLKKSKP
jgi:hypothetical protein